MFRVESKIFEKAINSQGCDKFLRIFEAIRGTPSTVKYIRCFIASYCMFHFRSMIYRH